MKKRQYKRNLLEAKMSELIAARDVSDESIYIVYQFLTDLLAEFELQAGGRLRRYYREQEEWQDKIRVAQIDLPF
jgi:hypothetical protein